MAKKESDSITITISTAKKELRSKRISFLLKPSTYEKAKEKCSKLDISLNECVNQFLESWINE